VPQVAAIFSILETVSIGGEVMRVPWFALFCLRDSLTVVEELEGLVVPVMRTVCPR
jgi:hypothetical protein